MIKEESIAGISEKNCIVLEFELDAPVGVKPFFVCTEMEDDAEHLRYAVRNLYNRIVRGLSLDEVDDVVSLDEEFSMIRYRNDYRHVWEETDGMFYTKTDGLANSEFEEIFKYHQIEPLDGERCGISTKHDLDDK